MPPWLREAFPVPTSFSFPLCCHPARYDYVEVEDLTEKTVLGRWCGSQSVPVAHTSKGNQLRIHFVSDEYFPSEPGFCIRYSLLPLVRTSSTLTSSHKQKDTKLLCVSWRSCSFMTDSKGQNYNFVTIPLVEICIFVFFQCHGAYNACNFNIYTKSFTDIKEDFTKQGFQTRDSTACTSFRSKWKTWTVQSALAVASFLRLRLPLFRSHHNLMFCVTALSKKPSAPVNPHFIYRSAQTTDEAFQCHRRRLRQRWGKWEVTQRGLPDPRGGLFRVPQIKVQN